MLFRNLRTRTKFSFTFFHNLTLISIRHHSNRLTGFHLTANPFSSKLQLLCQKNIFQQQKRYTINNAKSNKLCFYLSEAFDQSTKTYSSIFQNNREQSENNLKKDLEYFNKLAKGQSPRFIVIGCADSRVPFETISGLEPGDVFVHRNVANIVPNSDFNSLSVIQYGVEVLKVDHIIVCGHYGCGGVKASMENKDYGIISHQLKHIRDVYRYHIAELEAIENMNERYKRLVELNVIEQCRNILALPIVQKARISRKTGSPRIHGLVYDIGNGKLNKLDYSFQHDIKNSGRAYRLYDEEEFNFYVLMND